MYLDVFDRNPYGTNCWLLAAEGSSDAVVVEIVLHGVRDTGAVVRLAAGVLGRKGADVESDTRGAGGEDLARAGGDGLYPLPAVPGGPRPLGPLVFGSEPADIVNGATPALASGKYTLNFLQDAGAPFVHHRTVLLRGDWYASTVTLHGEGLFTAAFAPDIAAGTPGLLRWGKPFRTPPANENARNGAYSQFPNDEFHLFPIGPR